MKRAGIAVLLLVAVACQREAPPAQPRHVVVKTVPSDARNAKVNTLIPMTPPQVLDGAHLGATLGADGRVSSETTTFKKGEPIYLTLDVHESPVGLATEAAWQDAKGKELARERHEMKGAKTATFALKTPLAPGRYKVVGYWGGNIAAEKPFEVK